MQQSQGDQRGLQRTPDDKDQRWPKPVCRPAANGKARGQEKVGAKIVHAGHSPQQMPGHELLQGIDMVCPPHSSANGRWRRALNRVNA